MEELNYAKDIGKSNIKIMTRATRSYVSYTRNYVLRKHMLMCDRSGDSSPCRLFPVKFRDGCAYVHNASSHNTVKLRKNGVKRIDLQICLTRVLLGRRDTTKSCELRNCINMSILTPIDILLMSILAMDIECGHGLTRATIIG